jgi:nitrogen regulatory protein PII
VDRPHLKPFESMQLTDVRIVTIIAEEDLEDRLVRELKELGATGYTVARVRGEGAFGARISEWEGENIRLETIVDEPTAERIVATLSERYFQHRSLVLTVVAAQVVRGAKFLGQPPGA